jgi:hypothetical protein
VKTKTVELHEIDPDRCTWVVGKTGKAYSSCGQDALASPIEEMEICPFCKKLVEHVTWEEVMDAAAGNAEG